MSREDSGGGTLLAAGENVVTAIEVDFESSSFPETIPKELLSLTALTYLALSNVESTTFPSEIGLLSALTYLDWYDYDGVSVTLPTQLGSLTSLNYLSLSMDSVTGTLPSEMGLLASLAYLYWGTSLSALSCRMGG